METKIDIKKYKCTLCHTPCAVAIERDYPSNKLPTGCILGENREFDWKLIGTTTREEILEKKKDTITKKEVVDLLNRAADAVHVQNEYSKEKELTLEADKYLEEVAAESKPFAGEVVVITGTLPTLTRREAVEALEKAGAKVTAAVTDKVTLMVYGECPGSKRDKAWSLGIPGIEEDGLIRQLTRSVQKLDETKNAEAIHYIDIPKPQPTPEVTPLEKADMEKLIKERNLQIANDFYVEWLRRKGYSTPDGGAVSAWSLAYRTLIRERYTTLQADGVKAFSKYMVDGVYDV